jgi:hypothetical protein
VKIFATGELVGEDSATASRWYADDRRRSMSDPSPTPQINVSKIPGGTGIAGALFAIGSMLIFLFGVPRIRYFFIGALIVGFGIALVLRFVRRETPGKPWILPAMQEADRTTSSAQHEQPSERPEDPRHNLQALASA